MHEWLGGYMFVVTEVDIEFGRVNLESNDGSTRAKVTDFPVLPEVGEEFEIEYSVDGSSQYVYPQSVVNDGRSRKGKIAAALFAFFLGGLGAHNFYLGKTPRAVLQLLIGTLGWFVVLGWVAAVWATIEGVLILTSQKGSAWHRDGNGLELQD